MTISENVSLAERKLEVRHAFTPSAPIKRRDLFAGRSEQLKYVAGALSEPGQHAVIYGERGVGKTSLATMCADVVSPGSGIRKAVKINCQSSDSFSSIWRKVFSEIALVSQVPAFGFSKGTQAIISSASQYLSHVKEVTPDNICMGMRILTQRAPLAIFLDEFDRVTDPIAHRFFADTLKTLSDEVTPVTIILVGVADNVDELVKEHASVQRSIVQVHMPRMSDLELADIVVNGLASVRMNAEKSSIDHITTLSQGLPHYTHLLAQNAAVNAAHERSDTVRLEHVTTAIETAINGAQETIRDLCYRATLSNRSDIYRQVLLACACAPTDEKGFFTEPAIRAKLSLIMGNRQGVPQCTRYLNALAENRGPVLKKEKRNQQIQYRFIDPLVQPYITMRGVREGLIDSTVLKHTKNL